MKYHEKTFNSKIDTSLEFRLKKVSPVKLLSISTLFGNKDVESIEQLFVFSLENTEVNVGGTWLPVKEKNEDVFWPKTLEDNIPILQEVVTHFVTEVLSTVFTKSSKSTK